MSGNGAESGEQPAVVAHRWVSLLAICMASWLVWFAFAGLGVALPTIADEFNSDISTLQWANNAFSLVTGSLVIAGGKFGDLFGRRRMLQLGTLLLAGFSVVAALSPDETWLIVGRGLMGIGGALILPASLALIPPEFSGRAEITAFGVWQAVAWGGTAAGPAIGGLITDGLGWQWLFWLNLPLAAVIIPVVRLTTPESRESGASRRIDWLGLAAIGLAGFALLYALTDGPTLGWGDPLILGLFLATVVLGVAWYEIERHAREPLVDLRLFSLRPYNGALMANLAVNLTFAGISFLLVLWLQNARGYSAVEAGVLMLPATVGVLVGLPLGARADVHRGGRLPSLAGLLIGSAGLLVLGQLDAQSSLWLLAGALAIVGCGLGMVSVPVSNTTVGEVPLDLAGAAAGVFKISSMLGGAMGVAVLTGIARQLTASEASGVLESSGLSSGQVDQARHALVNSSSFQQAIASLPQDIQATVKRVATDAFTLGVADTMVATAVIVLISAAVAALLWPRKRRDPGAGP